MNILVIVVLLKVKTIEPKDIFALYPTNFTEIDNISAIIEEEQVQVLKDHNSTNKVVEKRESNSKERRYDNSNEIIDEIEARRRSMLLDKNFMRFGRSFGALRAKKWTDGGEDKVDLVRMLLLNGDYDLEDDAFSSHIPR